MVVRFYLSVACMKMDNNTEQETAILLYLIAKVFKSFRFSATRRKDLVEYSFILHSSYNSSFHVLSPKGPDLFVTSP